MVGMRRNLVVSRRVRRGAILTTVALALALGGCGRRGKLEPPPDPNNPFAYGQPDPTLDANGQPSKTKVGTHRRPKNPPIRPPTDSFILDPLL